MSETILIVEDEPALQETLAYNLTRQGYQVETVGDGVSALETARRIKPDLIVLDILLPNLDGFEVCRILRHETNIPIIILTARDDEIDRVLGLELGADDYLTKPFSMREFIARVKALLRRVKRIQEEADAKILPKGEILNFENLTIDLIRHEIRLNNKPISVKPKEFELLSFLAKHKGQVLSREIILKRVWGWEFIGDSRTVDVHIRWLREKIEPNPQEPTRIVTIRGIGYRFEG